MFHEDLRTHILTTRQGVERQEVQVASLGDHDLSKLKIRVLVVGGPTFSRQNSASDDTHKHF